MTIAVLSGQQDSNARASLLRHADLQQESKDNFLYIDPSKLILSENGSLNWSEVSYGMHCLHHSEGSVESVIVSPLCCHDSGQTFDEVVFEDVRVRTKALWASPHRCVTAPVGVSSCTSPSGSSVLLYVEQMRSSSSLQHMILQQMERPHQQLYSMKQALDWLIQLASALAHLHNLQPGMPHGRLSTSVVAVTSAAEVSLGRCISTFGCRDESPDSKRLHVLASRDQSNASDMAADALVPDSVRPIRSLPRYPLGGRRNSTGVTLAFPLSLGSLESLKSNQMEGHSTEPLHADDCFSGSPSTHGSTTCTGEDIPAFSDVFRKLRLEDIASSDPVVSSSELPGVGTVFKVSVHGLSRNSSGKESLFQAAEAAVWSRSDAGSEVKQHGGAFFARKMVAPELHHHSMPLESSQTEPLYSRDEVVRWSKSYRCLDAADTEHVLLDSPLMWMQQDSPKDHTPTASNDSTKPRAGLNVHLNVGTTVFSRAVARAPFETSLARDKHASHHGRWSDDGVNNSPVSERVCAKRSRSGLSVRLPSLVELPGTEERYAAGTLPSSGGGHVGSRPMSVPPATVDGMAAARSGHAGLSHYSISSPGGSYFGSTAAGEPQKNESCTEAERLAHSVMRLKFATSALTRIRQTVMCSAMFDLEREGSVMSKDNGGQSLMGVESPRLDNRRQRGSQKVLLLLESNQESMRSRWRRLMTRQSRVSNVESLPPPDADQGLSPPGICGDDIPYLAPEILEGGEPSTAGDCFAFGIIMYEVLSRELVASEIAMHADLEHVSDEEALKWHSSRVVEGERPHVPLSWPGELRDIIQLCWQDDALNRPSLASIQASLESCSVKCCEH